MNKKFWLWGCADLVTERDKRNLWRFNFWLLLWAASSASLLLALKAELFGSGWLPWAIALSPNVLGIIGARAYMRFLREADELLRRIQLEALALGFGAGVIFILGYRLLEQVGAPKIDTSGPFVVLMVFWSIGQFLGIRRYS